LHGAGLEHQLLVAVRARGQVPEGGYGVALYLFVVRRAEEFDERLQESCVDYGRLVERVYGYVADARHGREDEGEV
jgi:hypothetical protein